MPRITLDRAALRVDAITFSAPTVRRITMRVLNRSAILCPVDTGRLRASGKMAFRTTGLGLVGNVAYPVKYAAAVHDGAGPHIIRARKKRALKFQYRGQTVFATSVRHPGNRGRPFLVRAAREVAAREGLRFVTRT
jgi:hypothetical protein